MQEVVKLGRREFLRLGALVGGGLVLGIRLPGGVERTRNAAGGSALAFKPNAFLQIDPSGTVTIWVARAEMGQGVRTALPMIVADELDADWGQVRVLQADAHPTLYGRMMTVGSSSVRGGAWLPLRRAGAAAREMLVSAAAARWGVEASACRTENGRVYHDASRRSMGYGELVEAAAKLPVPAQPRLKDPSQFRLIGRRLPQVDVREKVTGRAVFGIDVRVPGMLFATVVHPPVFGGRAVGYDSGPALAVPGVRRVVQVTRGIAVVAENTWAAFRGAAALEVEWDHGTFADSSPRIFARLVDLAGRGGLEARRVGDAEAALARANRRVSAVYRAPYLAHATMEPMNCTAWIRDGRCEIWAPTQNPQGTQAAAAELARLPLDAVTVHVTYMGCGWGRRSRTDFVQDAVETAIAVGAPVQVLWSREEDMRHDFYRPAAVAAFEGGLDSEGRLTALRVRLAAQAIASRGGVDGPAVASVADTPYAIANFLVEYCRAEEPVPVGYWRSVGPSQNCFFLESFLDELAHTAGRDPVAFRLELLERAPRLRQVVELVAERSRWSERPSAGRARGIAVVEDKGGLVAEVAEVGIEGNELKVYKVWCVADCGRIVHPGIVEAQLSGAIGGGLGAALHGQITIERGRVRQSNFDDYPLLRLREMPEIDVYVVSSDEEPGGVGEPALPPIAPAVANAVFALTGRRLRELPLRV